MSRQISCCSSATGFTRAATIIRYERSESAGWKLRSGKTQRATSRTSCGRSNPCPFSWARSRYFLHLRSLLPRGGRPAMESDTEAAVAADLALLASVLAGRQDELAEALAAQ